MSSAFRYELVISGTIAEYNQTPDRRVVDRSNTDQEIKAIRGTDSISRRPDLSSAFRYELVISGTIGEYNQTPDRRVIDRSNTGKDLKAFCGTSDAIAPRRDLSILPVFRGTTNSNSVEITSW